MTDVNSARLVRLTQLLREWPGTADPRGPTKLLSDVVELGSSGAVLLAAELLSRTSLFERTLLAGALGDATGIAGRPELLECSRELSRGSSDLRATSVLSLASRFGASVTEELVERLGDTSQGVRRYALLSLAAFGADAAWTPVWSLFVKWIRRASERNQFEVTIALSYLLRFS